MRTTIPARGSEIIKADIRVGHAPCAWSIDDANGNLTSRTDARSITTTYIYDGVNRLTTRSYSDGTPTVTYTYDSASVTNSKGRLTAVSSSVSIMNYTAYDALGRITAANQVTDGQTYVMSYGYNLAGGRTSMTYPSGRVITTGYDDAGRLAGVRDNRAASTTPEERQPIPRIECNTRPTDQSQ
jgi:YD repeat-containing protein